MNDGQSPERDEALFEDLSIFSDRVLLADRGGRIVHVSPVLAEEAGKNCDTLGALFGTELAEKILRAYSYFATASYPLVWQGQRTFLSVVPHESGICVMLLSPKGEDVRAFSGNAEQFERDMRNQLATMSAALESLKNSVGQSDPDIQTRLAVLRRGIIRLMRLTGNHADSLRFEAGRLQIRRSSFLLGRRLGELFERCRPVFQAANIGLFWKGPEKDKVFIADPEALDRMVYNILCNFLVFTHSEHRVEVSLVFNHKEAAVSFLNAGKAPEKREAPPYMPQETAAAGTGLYLVSALASLHGGHFTMTVDGAQGARARIVLPLVEGSDLFLFSPKLSVSGGVDPMLLELSPALDPRYFV